MDNETIILIRNKINTMLNNLSGIMDNIDMDEKRKAKKQISMMAVQLQHLRGIIDGTEQQDD